MSNTVTKTPLQSTNFWTGIATVIAGAFSYFAVSPDLSAADVLVGEAQKAVDAISTKNYVAIFAVAINVVNIFVHLFKK